MGAKPLNIYIDGAENSGRRSLLSWLEFGIFRENFWKKVGLRDDFSTRIQYSTIKHNKTELCVWISPKSFLFKGMSENIQGIILIVDATDPKSFEGAYKELERLFWYKEQKCPVLVFLNKHDLLGTLPKEVIINQIRLQEFEVEYKVEEISIKEGTRIKEGLDWLINAIKDTKKNKK